MKNITTFIFDLDGTLLNTLTDIANSVNFALEKHNYSTHSYDKVKTFVGNGSKLLIKRAMPQNHTEQEFEQTYSDYMAHYSVHSKDNTKPYDGVLDTLKQLKELGFKTAILSNKPDSQTKVLAQEVFTGLIDYAQGQINGVPEKPAPNGVYSVLKKLDSLAENTVFVGDSDVDILTGKNANLFSVGVSWGFRSVRELEKTGADIIIDEMPELLGLFK